MFTIFCFCVGFLVLAVIAQSILCLKAASGKGRDVEIPGERIELTAE